jgi:hypothetical protein
VILIDGKWRIKIESCMYVNDRIIALKLKVGYNVTVVLSVTQEKSFVLGSAG